METKRSKRDFTADEVENCNSRQNSNDATSQNGQVLYADGIVNETCDAVGEGEERAVEPMTAMTPCSGV